MGAPQAAVGAVGSSRKGLGARRVEALRASGACVYPRTSNVASSPLRNDTVPRARDPFVPVTVTS